MSLVFQSASYKKNFFFFVLCISFLGGEKTEKPEPTFPDTIEEFGYKFNQGLLSLLFLLLFIVVVCCLLLLLFVVVVYSVHTCESVHKRDTQVLEFYWEIFTY